jgi:hypothetical protein
MAERVFPLFTRKSNVNGLAAVWNRIPGDIRQRVVMMAFEQPELSPRELATRFTDTNSYYVSESSVYRTWAGADVRMHDLRHTVGTYAGQTGGANLSLYAIS